ncbi:hypothetical protein C3L33_08627, partial [Rhododendron williamsianum]
MSFHYVNGMRNPGMWEFRAAAVTYGGNSRFLTLIGRRGLSWVPVAFEDTLGGAPFTLSNGTAFKVTFLSCFGIMVNAIKGLLISCDIPMAQFIINLDNSLPPSQKFIIHNLDSTHLFVQPHVSEMIRSAIAEFRDQISYEKPA